METDGELLSRLRAGDEEAFVMLVGRYNGSLLRLARSYVPNDAVAEEAVQDTWMGVVRGVDRFEGRSSFKTWLFRILINRARIGRHPRAPRSLAERQRAGGGPVTLRCRRRMGPAARVVGGYR